MQKSQEQIQETKNFLELHHEEQPNYQKRLMSKKDNMASPSNQEQPCDRNSKVIKQIGVSNTPDDGNLTHNFLFDNDKIAKPEPSLIKLKQYTNYKSIIKKDKKSYMSQNSFDSNFIRVPQVS